MKTQVLTPKTTLKSNIDLLTTDDFEFRFEGQENKAYASHPDLLCYIIYDFSTEKVSYDETDESITEELLDDIIDIMYTYKEDHEYEVSRWTEPYHYLNQ